MTNSRGGSSDRHLDTAAHEAPPDVGDAQPGEGKPRSQVRRLILASASPRRASLLRQAGYRFEVIPPTHDEPDPQRLTLTPPQLAEALSFFKAASVSARVGAGTILAADTIVVCGGDVFGKPRDAEHARRILASLAGKVQDVITGVTLLDAETHRRLIRHELTRVTMRPMSPEQLDAYVAAGDWKGKAGAYGIQDTGDAFVASYEGSFSNVVGLPLELVDQMLREFT